MSPVFEILPEHIDPKENNLFLEVKNNGLSYFFENAETNVINGVMVFHFNENNLRDTPEVLKDIFHDQTLLQKDFKKTVVVYSYEESVLIPLKFYKPELKNNAFEIIFGDLNQGLLFNEFIYEQDIYNVYKIPSLVHNSLAAQFPTASFNHQYSMLLKKLPKENDVLQVIFYHDKIIICLVKNGNLQIIQSYYYQSAEDVIYYLLNVCSQFEMENVPVELNGMIEKDSALFKEIYKYFLKVTFNDFNNSFTCIKKIKEYPTHYFSHLFYMTSCV